MYLKCILDSNVIIDTLSKFYTKVINIKKYLKGGMMQHPIY